MNELDNEKLFYERFYALHRDPVLVSVLAAFGIGVFRRSSVLEGFAEFLAMQSIRGRRAVEIGTCKGLTALVLARHFDEVVTFDIVDDPDRERIAEFSGVKNIRFVTVKDNAEKARAIGGLDFDFAYVDGDHIRDTRTDFALVEKCGRVLFHEHWPAQPEVMALVDELCDRGRVLKKGKIAYWTAL